MEKQQTPNLHDVSSNLTDPAIMVLTLVQNKRKYKLISIHGWQTVKLHVLEGDDNVKRDELLAKGYTEEQVTDILNTFHGINKENESLKSEVLKKAEIESKYNEAQKTLDEINKAKLSEDERLKLEKEEIAKNLKESKMIVNKAKAMQVLTGLDIDDELISTLVTDDEESTLKNANMLKARFDVFKETIEKQTKESITNLDVKPNLTNIPQGDDVMTFEKFRTLSQEEQNKFAVEHPDEFEKL